VNLNLGVVVAGRHVFEIKLGQTDDSLQKCVSKISNILLAVVAGERERTSPHQCRKEWPPQQTRA
jgi:hypothetical protein